MARKPTSGSDWTLSTASGANRATGAITGGWVATVETAPLGDVCGVGIFFNGLGISSSAMQHRNMMDDAYLVFRRFSRFVS